MVNLSSLLQELRERIAASSSTPPPSSNNGEDDPLDTRFRTVLPNLLQSYVLPSSSANEREVIAVLKLLSHTARNFPGVFFHGKSNAVLPIIGRILPFFAEPAFISRHGVIFETIGSLLSLLRSGDREVYRQFFLDAMLVVEEILYIASVCADESSVAASKEPLKCFYETFSGISDGPALFGGLPACCKPVEGPGVLINLTDKTRWRPFATWTIKILSKCLTEGTLYVEGLINASFISAACTLLCYGDSALHMACFDFARIAATIIDAEIIPSEKLIRSISSILGSVETESSIFRNTAYDSSMGNCLHVLHSSCSDDVVEFTAAELVNVFHQSLQSTESIELKVAMCNAYIRIARTCPTHIWRPETLVNMLRSSKLCLPLIDCIRVVVGLLLLDHVGEQAIDNCKVGGKRPVPNLDSLSYKRQKIDENGKHISSSEVQIRPEFTCKKDKDYVDYIWGTFSSFVCLLEPFGFGANLLRHDDALTAVSILSIAFCSYPKMGLSHQIFQQINAWMHWVCEQAKGSSSITFDISIYLNAVHSILLLQNTHSLENVIFQNKDEDLVLMKVLLMLPWTHSLVAGQAYSLWQTKCFSVQALSKIGTGFEIEKIILEVLDLALHDETQEVRVEALTSMPAIVFSAGHGVLTHMVERLELEIEKSDKVDVTVPLSIGYLACLYGSSEAIDSVNACKLFLSDVNESFFPTIDLLSRGFWCPKCDRRDISNQNQFHKAILLPNVQTIAVDSNCPFDNLQSIFFKLLFDESSKEVQVACVGIIPRILTHGTRDILLKRRSQWVQCIEVLLVHKKKTVREAFSAQISCFLEEHCLICLFGDQDSSSKTKEQKFLDKLKHALAASKDSEILETLLESTAAIMNVVDIHDELFFYSLILLVDQLDNPHMTVRMTASRLIRRSCEFHLKGGFNLLLFKVVSIRNELFDYLCARLVSRPAMIKEFAEAVLGVETEELVKKMVPVVLPKLVVSQQKDDDDQAVVTLNELAKHLNTDLVPLIVNWLPKVLAFALLRANGQDLFSALQFYHVQTGSDNQEIFGAALPALLDELVCFLGHGDTNESNERLARVPQMIQEVARILTGSDDLPGFLRNHFVGLLNSIDRKMLHAEDLSIQKQALKRIQMLIEMMGSQLTTYLPKIMVLLMRAVEKEPLQSEGLSVLHFFIKQLTVISPLSTKHIISQVFASLIPFLERNKESISLHLNKVVQILEQLVIENKVLLKQHIRELPFLPSIPVLTEVNKVIQEARGSMTLKDHLLDVVDGLNHESLNVRYMVACELIKLLNINRKDVTAMIGGEAGSDMDILSSLITSLLRGCAEESRTVVGQRLKLVCADCLGALGAVDPAKVKVVSCERFKIECSDDDLIFELIHKHLARAFRAASDTVVQDSAALAIQELLKFAGCQESLDKTVHWSMDDSSNEKTRGQRLWDRFSNYVKEIIAPCLTSRFQLPNVSESSSPCLIYRPSMSFRRWIFSWIKKLTINATGCRSSIFNACRGIVRHDMQTAIYLLPYLVLNAVCYSTAEERHGITEEIHCVLNAAASENNGEGITGGQSEVCIQAVFTLLDNLGQWADDVKQEVALSQSLQPMISRQQTTKPTGQTTDQLLIQCNNVSELLAAIPNVTLARASFRCQAYARALLYFESHMLKISGSFNPAAERSGLFEDEDVSFLMEIYSGLDEPDGLFGLARLRKSSSLHDQLLINKKAGNWAEVLTSCEQALQMEPTSVQRHSDVLNCLLNMCHLQAMVTHVDGLISRVPQYKRTWCMQGTQAAWRLGRWDLMDEYLSGADEEGLVCSSSESYASFDMDVAKILQAMMKKNQFSVAEKIAQSKQALLAPLAAAGMDSYTRAYPFVVKLHMLRELEDFHNLLVNDSFLEKPFQLCDPKFMEVVEDWDNRLKLTQPSLWTREPLLSFRRLVFGASGLGAYVGNCWLQYAKLCRSAGHYETANRAILESQSSGAPNVNMEKAKLLWSTGRSDGAIAELEYSLLNLPIDIVGSSVVSSLTSLSAVPLNTVSLPITQASNENRDIAKPLLLYSRWIHYTGQKQRDEVLSLYSKVRVLQPRWEKAYFYLAKYCDDLFVDAKRRQEESFGPTRSRILPTISSITEEKPWFDYLADALLLYAKGLHRGHRNLFQALPRLLTLWFDFGSQFQREKLSSRKEFKEVNKKIMSIMRGCLKDLPKYLWLTALPQLVSRICHQNDDIVRLVKIIITSVLQNYPQQALWIMAAVSKSTVPSRREAAAEIIQAARKESYQGNDGLNLFVQFATFIDHLIRLCFHAGQPKAKTINISTEFSALKRMMPLGIIMPIQQALTLSLPTYDTNQTDHLKSDIFSATDLVTISGIKDEAEILSSLQRPKKVYSLTLTSFFQYETFLP